MSDSRQKLRAILLAFVMVTSVMAGTAAFAGSAAAVGNDQGAVNTPGTPADLAVGSSSASHDLNDGSNVVIDTGSDGASAAIKIDLSPLTDNGVDLSDADVSASASSGGGDSATAISVSDGEARVVVTDGTSDEGATDVTLGRLELTGLDTTNANIAQGESYLLQVDGDNAGVFDSSQYEVDATGRTNQFSLASFEVENLNTGNTVIETSLSDAIDEANGDGADSDGFDVSGTNENVVIRIAEGTITADTGTLSKLTRGDTTIEPLDGARVTLENNNGGDTLIVDSDADDVTIRGLNFDQATNPGRSAVEIEANNGNIAITNNTFIDISDDDTTNVVDVSDEAETVEISENDFNGDGVAAEAIDTDATGTDGTALELTVTDNGISGFDDAILIDDDDDDITSATIESNTFENNNQHVADDNSITSLNTVFNNNDFSGTFVTEADVSGNIQNGIYGTLEDYVTDEDPDDSSGNTITLAGTHTNLDSTVEIGANDDVTVTAPSGATIQASGDVFDLDGGGATGITVNNVTFDLSGGAHSAVISAGQSFDELSITDNDFNGGDSGNPALDLDDASKLNALSITDNTFDSDSSSNAYDGIDLDSAGLFDNSDTVVIDGNSFEDADNIALDIRTDNSNVNLEITDNEITNQSAAEGIDADIDNANDVNIRNNILTGEDDSGGTRVGIDLEASGSSVGDTISVNSNTITDFRDDEADDGTALDIDPDNVQVTDNTLENNAIHVDDVNDNFDTTTLINQNDIIRPVLERASEGGSLSDQRIFGTISIAADDVSSGNFIDVGEGTYTEDNIVVAQDATFDGGGDATVTTDASDNIFDVGATGGETIIRGFTLDPTDDNANADINIATSDEIVIENNTFTGPGTTARDAVKVADIGGAVPVTLNDNDISNYQVGVIVDDDDTGGGDTDVDIEIVRSSLTENDIGIDLIEVSDNDDDSPDNENVRIHFNNIVNNRIGLSSDLDADDLNDLSARANWWGAESGPSGDDTTTDFDGNGDEVDDTDDVSVNPWLGQSSDQLPTDGYVVIDDKNDIQTGTAAPGGNIGGADSKVADVLVATLNDTAAEGEDESTSVLLGNDTITIIERTGSASAVNPIEYDIDPDADALGNFTLTAKNNDGDIPEGTGVQAFVGSPDDIELTVNKQQLLANNDDVASFTATVVDANGNAVNPDVADDGISYVIDNGSNAAVTRIVEEDDTRVSAPNSEAKLNITAGESGFELEVTTAADSLGFSDEVTVETVNQQLNVDVSPQTITATEETNIIVDVTEAGTDSGVDNADVELSGAGVSESIQTNSTGVATATLNASEAGTIDVNVTADGFEAASESITVEEPEAPPTATVTFDDQTVTNGSTSVDVASATFNGSEDFVIVVHRASPGDNGVVDGTDEIGNKIGSSDVLTNNTVSDVPVNLTKNLDEGGNTQLTENQTLIAMLHFANESGDTNFGSPIVRDGTPVFDQADITIEPESPIPGVPGRFDENADGEIDIGELGQAGQAFAQGDLTITELGEVGQAFAS